MTITDFGRNSFVEVKGLKERIREAEKEIKMREIKFRGIQRFGENKGKWAFGSLLILGLRHYIVPIPPKHETPADDVTLLAQVCERVEVDAETVGQFTGLKDKNGQDVFAGDKLQSKDGLRKYEVVWNERQCNWFLRGISTAWAVNEPTWKDYELIEDKEIEDKEDE